MRTECLVCGNVGTVLDVKVRCLQVMPGSWQEAVEREVNLTECNLGALLNSPQRQEFQYGPAIHGTITLTAERLADGLFKIAARVANQTPLEHPEQFTRDEVLPYSLVAAHTLLAVRGGEFVSLIDPPEQFRQAASECQNVGAWPILAPIPGCGPDPDR